MLTIEFNALFLCNLMKSILFYKNLKKVSFLSHKGISLLLIALKYVECFWHENHVPRYHYYQKHLVSISYVQRAVFEELQGRALSQGPLIACLNKYFILSLLPLRSFRYHKKNMTQCVGVVKQTQILGHFAAIFCASLNVIPE